jgi:hypothetical protein
MGTLVRFDIERLRRQHHLAHFVETGTADGDGTAFASGFGFETLTTIEIMPALAANARSRFSADPRVLVLEGDTSEVLEEVCRNTDGPALFWLDAHFPGAHHGADYAAVENVATRLPLEREIEAIAKRRQRDVVIIDDARIYIDGPFDNGNLPPDWPPLRGVTRSLDFIRKAFAGTHNVAIDYADEGYVLVSPVL